MLIVNQKQGLTAAFLGETGTACVGNPDLDRAQTRSSECIAMLLDPLGTIRSFSHGRAQA